MKLSMGFLPAALCLPALSPAGKGHLGLVLADGSKGAETDLCRWQGKRERSPTIPGGCPGTYGRSLTLFGHTQSRQFSVLGTEDKVIIK
jgi:hypothetical protein